MKTSDFDPMSRKTIRMMSEIPALLNLAFDHESDNNKDDEGDEFRMVVFFSILYFTSIYNVHLEIYNSSINMFTH